MLERIKEKRMRIGGFFGGVMESLYYLVLFIWGLRDWLGDRG